MVAECMYKFWWVWIIIPDKDYAFIYEEIETFKNGKTQIILQDDEKVDFS